MFNLAKGTKLKTLKDIVVHDRNTKEKYVIAIESFGEIEYINDEKIVMCFGGKSAVYYDKDITRFKEYIEVL